MWVGLGFLEKRPKVWNLLKTILVALLFSTQHIIDAGRAISFGIMPIMQYIYGVLIGDARVEREIQVILFSNEFIVGRIIAIVGAAVLLLTAVQYFQNRTKHDFIKVGIFSKVRHPQFMGIIFVGLGLTVMTLTYNGGGRFETFLMVTGTWLIQALCYITIAKLEEWKLTKRFKEKYNQYQQKVPFMFPIKGPLRIPETLFTIVITVLIYVLLIVFPYQLIRVI